MTLVLHYSNLGTVPYLKAWKMQEQLQQKLIAGQRGSLRTDHTCSQSGTHSEGKPEQNILPAGYLLFLEHPHVYTIGKSGKEENLLFPGHVLRKKGIDVIKTDRGGDITYHGPGQLVGYPVLNLKSFDLGVASYIERLEEVIIRTAAHFDITARRVPSRTGVWAGNNKLCAMGIKCSRYVCMHGFALNIRTRLDYFHGIIPCGITDGGVTSLERLCDPAPDMETVSEILLIHFQQLFDCTIEKKTIPEIDSHEK